MHSLIAPIAEVLHNWLTGHFGAVKSNASVGRGTHALK